MELVWTDENGTPIDLTGYTARMQARTSHDSTTTFISLTSASGITLGGVTGEVTITMTPTQTAAITQEGVWDIEFVNGSYVARPLEGNVLLAKEVTR